MASGHSVEFAGSGMFRLQFSCLLGQDVASRCWRGAPRAAQTILLAINLKGGALRVASDLVLRRFTVVGTGVFVFGSGVGASRSIPSFKRA